MLSVGFPSFGSVPLCSTCASLSDENEFCSDMFRPDVLQDLFGKGHLNLESPECLEPGSDCDELDDVVKLSTAKAVIHVRVGRPVRYNCGVFKNKTTTIKSQYG